jgi:hypothetical protein
VRYRSPQQHLSRGRAREVRRQRRERRIVPAIYTVHEDAQGFVVGFVVRLDASCQQLFPNPLASAGTVELTSIDATRVLGQLDLRFSDGGRVVGSFDAPVIEGIDVCGTFGMTGGQFGPICIEDPKCSTSP